MAFNGDWVAGQDWSTLVGGPQVLVSGDVPRQWLLLKLEGLSGSCVLPWDQGAGEGGGGLPTCALWFLLATQNSLKLVIGPLGDAPPSV